jgi:hypothetical protein
MVDTPKKEFSLFDTSNDDNQLGPIVVAVIVILLVVFAALVSGHNHLP